MHRTGYRASVRDPIGSLPERTSGTRKSHGLPTTFTRVSTSGLQAFRSIVGCILSNELLDNFPVHRFAVHRGRIMEVYVALSGDRLVESLGEPSSPRIAARLTELGIVPSEGHRGAKNPSRDRRLGA